MGVDRREDAGAIFARHVAVERVIEEYPNLSNNDMAAKLGMPKATFSRYRKVIQGRHSGLDPELIVQMRTKHRETLDKAIVDTAEVFAEAIDRARSSEKPDYVGIAMLGKTYQGFLDSKAKYDGLNAPKYSAFEDEIELFIQEKAMTDDEAEEYRRIAIGDGKRRMLKA